MTEPELPGVQHLAGMIFRESGSVNFVAQNRVTEMMKMDANLMSAATMQAAFD